jgi:hypothetical protein
MPKTSFCETRFFGASEIMTHPAESTHWYAKDGTPVYEVPSANGSMRPTTLRDARKLNLYPSVTSIIRCAAAPGLERWKQEQVLHAALTLPVIAGETEENYLDRIWRDSRDQGNKAAARGTAIHAAIEGRDVLGEYGYHVNGTMEAIGKYFGDGVERGLRAEMSFAHPLGFGGKCDDHDRYGNVVLDYKTTEKDLSDIKTWDEHDLQLAAYREGLGLPNARCAIVYVSVTKPGEAKVIEIPEAKLQRGWMMFKALLAYHQAKTGYAPV